MQNGIEKRRAILSGLFPDGVPRLWSPLLTHYREDGSIDLERMTAHFRFVSPWVKGLLIPGTTGDGWEFNDEETLQVTEFALSMAKGYKAKLLLGVLRTDAEAVKGVISRMRSLIDRKKPGLSGTVEGLGASGVCGFAVCPPKGKGMPQEEIEAALSGILDLGLPTALYQLPTVTRNEVSPETFERLARRYPHLIFFKDSSGRDLIPLSDVDKGDVFLVRGGEGDYIRWLKIAGGVYDGFLLSVTNSFSAELAALVSALEDGDRQTAGDISERITKALFNTIGLVKALPCGNVFTNANKAIDHFYAFGPGASGKEGPMLKGGVRIPGEVIAATADILADCRLMPSKGYLE